MGKEVSFEGSVLGTGGCSSKVDVLGINVSFGGGVLMVFFLLHGESSS